MTGNARYAIQLTAPGIASDGTTQQAGTNINCVLWDGVSLYTPHDFAGNTTNVEIIPATPGMVFYNPPPTGTILATLEDDWTASNGGTLILPAGCGFANITLGGTIAGCSIWLPPQPAVGPGSEIQIDVSGTGTITACALFDGSGTHLVTTAVVAPKVVRGMFTNNGWVTLPN